MKKYRWDYQIKLGSISLVMLCLFIEIPLLNNFTAISSSGHEGNPQRGKALQKRLRVFASEENELAVVPRSSFVIASQKKKQDSVVIFQPPPEDAEPEETSGAASRNGKQCPGDISAKAEGERFKFRAIVPQTNSGLTTQEYPTFWAYIPQTTAQSAILSIAKAGEKPHWQQKIALTGKSGEIGIKLNRNAPGLSINQNYRWALILVCNAHPHPNDPVIIAGVKRIDHNSPSNITGLEQAAWYAKRGIWYDALNVLAKEKYSLDNGEILWYKYLQSGGILIDNWQLTMNNWRSQ